MNYKNLMSLLVTTALTATCFSASAAADEIKQRILKFGHLSTDESPLGQGALKFAELVAKGSDGRIQIKIYPAGQLGSEAQQIGATQGGLQDFVMLSSTPMSSVVRDLQVLDFPGVVATPQEADKLLDGPIGQKILKEFETKRLIGLAYFENGFRHLTNNKHQVQTVAEMAGLKVRVQQSPSSVDFLKSLNTNAIPMSWNQLYTALETNTVDGQENPIGTIHMAKLNEVQKYMTLTAHAYGAHVVVGSQKVWQSLSSKEKEIISTAVVEARDYQRTVNRGSEEKMLSEMKAGGLVVDTFPAEEVDKMTALAKPVLEKYLKGVSPDIAKAILDRSYQ